MKTGVQVYRNYLNILDSGFRRNDEKRGIVTFYETINKASASDLDKIKGIGPNVAELIVSYRNEHGAFKSWDDVAKIPGFGERMLEELKSSASISGEK